MKKGMSPLIASVLLIAVTVGVAAILINWFTSYTKGQTSKISSSTTTECTYKNIDFTSNPTYDNDTNTLTLKLENSGTSEVNVTDEYIEFEGDSNVYHCTKSINLAAGAPQQVTITNSDCSSNLPATDETLSEVKLVYKEPCQGFYSKWSSQ